MISFCFITFVSLLSFPGAVHTVSHCKLSPLDAEWPSNEEWAALNASIQGTLIRTAPVASSCYTGNPFVSTESCTSVKKYWSYAAYHSAWPESVDYSIYTNNSCVPPGVVGYTEGLYHRSSSSVYCQCDDRGAGSEGNAVGVQKEYPYCGEGNGP